MADAAPSTPPIDRAIVAERLSGLSPRTMIALSKAAVQVATKRGNRLGFVEPMCVGEYVSSERIDCDDRKGQSEPLSDEHLRMCDASIAVNAVCSRLSTAYPIMKLGLTDEDVEALASLGTPCAFGDARTATTVVDKAVRDAVEITAGHPFLKEGCEGLADLCRDGRSMWSHYLDKACFDVFRQQCRLVPVKICVYREGGHFAQHVDTPKADPT